MTELRRLLIGCDILRREVEYLFADNSWLCSRLFLTSSLHFDFDLMRDTLSAAIEKNRDKEILLLYGTCHPCIDTIPGTRRIPCQNCIEMLLGHDLFTAELGNGAYFLLEQWANEWDHVLEKTFGNRQVAREIFQLDRRYILALRTPCSGDFSKQAEAAAESVNLPLRWMDVSLDHLKQKLEALFAPSSDQSEYQRQRADRLAAEKSYLQLVNTMMNRLSALPGLENTIQNLLELVVDSIGGTTAGLYYFIDGLVCYTNLDGVKKEGIVIEDPLVLEAVRSGRPVHESRNFQDTLMQTREFASASTWAVPLLTGNTLVGLFKIENMHLESDDFLPNLGAFFKYAALILKNEIQNYVKLQDAFEKLKREKDEHLESRKMLFQQEKLASIGQLAAGVAHEINNPMGFITSNLGTLQKYVERMVRYTAITNELLERFLPVEETARLQEQRRQLKIDRIMADANMLVSESLEGADRVKKIVNDLKNFARTDNSQQQPVRINDCIAMALNLVKNEYKYNAELILELHDDLPEIKGNSQQIVQVLSNLVVNASHALVKTGVITVKSWQEDQLVCFSVADNGCGIPEELHNRIFEPFFTTKEVGKGTGLGLSISNEIIKKHGGDISVESEDGKGTVFTVTLPFTDLSGEDNRI